MTVKELIEELQKCPQNAEVVLKDITVFPHLEGCPTHAPIINIREKLTDVMRWNEMDYKNEELTEYVCLGFDNIKEIEEFEKQFRD